MLTVEQKILGATVIDLEKELSRMSSEFGIPEIDVVSNWRSFVRFDWSKSIFRLHFLSQHAKKVKNENPRSAKRFAYVTKYECNICKGLFTSNGIELDHIKDENSMKSLEDATTFFKSIALPSYDELQILCKDSRKTVKGKKVTTYHGCHGIKTYASRYGVSFEQARVEKQFIEIKKDKNVLDKIKEYNVQSITKLKKDQDSLFRELLLERMSNE